MSLPSSMRALVQVSHGGPADMRLVTDAPVPVPPPGHILLRVTAAGVNYVDITRSRGAFAPSPRPPFTAGFEAVGEVVAHGDGASTPPLGAHVIAAGPGAFAGFACVPAAAAMPVPAGWTDEQALGLVVNWPTALAILRLGRLARDETVVIHAAAGATGSSALVLAKHLGARVIAIASPRKHDDVRAADHALDAHDPDLVATILDLTAGHGADLVLESCGGETFAHSLAIAKRVTGRVVVFGLSGGEALLRNWDLVYQHQVQLIGFNLGTLIQHAPQMFGEIMGELGALIAAGVIRPARPKMFAFADATTALLDLENRRTIGKLGLIP